ncbi:MAG: prepilin-type N-terminal cleavage/methylation domain-containing protein [Oscillospiraceae bacterium]
MTKKKNSGKKGFTLIELIVVLAILAVIAAIAVPTAFGAITDAEDAAAAASVRSMESVLRTTKSMSTINKDIATFQKEVVLLYKNGKFEIDGTKNVVNEYYLKAFEGAGIQVSDKAYFHIYISINPKTQAYYYNIVYSPKGVKTKVKPYYTLDSSTGKITKDDGKEVG